MRVISALCLIAFLVIVGIPTFFIILGTLEILAEYFR